MFLRSMCLIDDDDFLTAGLPAMFVSIAVVIGIAVVVVYVYKRLVRNYSCLLFTLLICRMVIYTRDSLNADSVNAQNTYI